MFHDKERILIRCKLFKNKYKQGFEEQENEYFTNLHMNVFIKAFSYSYTYCFRHHLCHHQCYNYGCGARVEDENAKMNPPWEWDFVMCS